MCVCVLNNNNNKKTSKTKIKFSEKFHFYSLHFKFSFIEIFFFFAKDPHSHHIKLWTRHNFEDTKHTHTHVHQNHGSLDNYLAVSKIDFHFSYNFVACYYTYFKRSLSNCCCCCFCHFGTKFFILSRSYTCP